VRFTEFKIYCGVCGKRFSVIAGGGGGYGRTIVCCGKECHDVLELWNAKSILGKPIEQE
jgi:hypothetical protein